MSRYIFYALVVFLLYKLIFSFIIPIFVASKKMRDQFQHAKQQMEDQQNLHQKEQGSSREVPKQTGKLGEYIEFEEIRK